jgi:hypothetical protein
LKGDFSRFTFRKEKHYRKVNIQQGRVQIDSDWNEQNEIQTEYDRSYLQDVIGKNGTPLNEYEGFEISPNILLNWNTFPKNEDDSKALKAFLREEFAVGDWIDNDNVQFVKQPEKTISARSGETPLQSVSITLNNDDPKEATEATLAIDDKPKGTFTKRKKEDDDLYTDRKWYKISCGKNGKQGHYFVDGILCENEAEVDASEQPDLPLLKVLFNWGNIPKSPDNDDSDFKHLRQILKEGFQVEWINDPNIEVKKENENENENKKITLSKSGQPKPNVSIELNDEPSKATRATLTIEGLNNNPPDIRKEKLVVRHNKDNANKYIYYYKDKKIALPTNPGRYLVYLDVWERHLTMLDDPAIREYALGGPDTATRIKIIWQVKILPISDNDINESDKVIIKKIEDSWNDVNLSLPINYYPLKDPDFILHTLKYSGTPPDLIGTLSAQLSPADGNNKNEDICVLPPSAIYQGLENHLYRVEIHQGSDLDSNNSNVGTTFKWSADNAMVVSQISDFSHGRLKIKSIGDARSLGFNVGQWIEITDDKREFIGEPGILVKITGVDTDTLSFDPSSISTEEDLSDENFPQEYNPKVRRWDTITPDSKKGALNIMDQESKKFNSISLGQEGIEVKFADGVYRTGDYWLIPARTAFGDGAGGIEWDQKGNTPKSNPPLGLKHHFNPLAIIKYNDDKTIQVLADCRSFFRPLSNSVSLHYVSGDGQQAAEDGKLPFPLIACLSIGNTPMPGMKVRFSMVKGNGKLSDLTESTSSTGHTASIVLLTDEEGLVNCKWMLDTENHDQQVQTTLLISERENINLPKLYFNAAFEKPVDKGIVANTATVHLINLTPNQTLKYGPIEHQTGTNNPAIILGLADNTFTEELLKGNLHFESIQEGTASQFHIKIRYVPIAAPKTDITLRFWAFASKNITLDPGGDFPPES